MSAVDHRRARVGFPAATPALALCVAALGGCAGSVGGSRAPSGNGAGETGSAGSSAGSGNAGSGIATGTGGSSNGAGGQPAISTGAAGSTGSAGTTGPAGAGGAGGAFGTGQDGSADAAPADGGADAGTGSCLVTITPLVPGSFGNLEAGPSSTLRLQASVSGLAGDRDAGAPHWLWSVKVAGGPSVADLPCTPVDDTGATIDVPLASAGTYQIQARIEGAPACDRAPLIVVVQPPQTPSFRFRVTPPSASQLPVRETLVKSTAIGGGPHALDLGDAKSSLIVSLAPLDVRGFAIPSYVRITSPSFAFDLEGDTGRGALVAPLSTALTYDVLIVPDDGLAPLLVSGTPDSVSNKMSIVPGAVVTGSTRDGNGQAVAGARIVLEAGLRPSTVGVSAADGSFGLTTRDGILAADILAPSGSGLPDAHVAASPGIVLLAGATSLDLSMSWAKVPAAPLTITATKPGGGAAVAGARVRVDLADTLSDVGTLSVRGVPSAELSATGTAHADGVTDAQGIAHLGLLPVGTYHLVVAPADGDPSVAITPSDVVLPSTGASPHVALAPPAAFSGTLLPKGPTAGAKLTAIDRGPLAAVTLPRATAAADGSYTLLLAAGRSYELLVEPAPGAALGRGVIAVVSPDGTTNVRSDVVPPALVWEGSVTGAGHAIAGALVEVFCAPPAASCIDPTLAVAQGMTGADGTLTLTLPSPLPSP
ncbi:MAG TPA: hypothetical protein VG319_04095 [Polyangia bacterium]|nr:hypothetical protein [Polyangia bacterium]